MWRQLLRDSRVILKAWMHLFWFLKQRSMSAFHGTEDVVARPEPLQSEAMSHIEHADIERSLHNREPGIYVDLISGEALFASPDEYESGTRWLNFTKPMAPANVREVYNTSHGIIRTELS